jgi:DNA-binding PadR family transcriptional regulator
VSKAWVDAGFKDDVAIHGAPRRARAVWQSRHVPPSSGPLATLPTIAGIRQPSGFNGPLRRPGGKESDAPWYFPESVGVMNVPLALLGLLEREPSHGYDLKRDYDQLFGRDKPLSFGQVYATLGRLARDGKVVVSEERGAGPDRKRYAITDLGMTQVGTWLTQPAEPEPHLQTVLFAKVVLALLLDRPAEQYLDAQRSAHLQRIQCLTRINNRGDLIDVVLADHGLFHLQADLRWMEFVAARLDALAQEVRR